VQTGLTADVAANDFAGDQLTHVNTVLADNRDRACPRFQARSITTPMPKPPCGRRIWNIINTIENDPVLQALSIKDDNPGFNFRTPRIGHGAER